MIQYQVKIDGMHCSMCEAHVNDLFRRALNPKSVRSSHKKGETILVFEEPKVSKEIKDALDNSGYIVLSIEEQPYQKKGFFSFLKH